MRAEEAGAAGHQNPLLKVHRKSRRLERPSAVIVGGISPRYRTSGDLMSPEQRIYAARPQLGCGHQCAVQHDPNLAAQEVEQDRHAFPLRNAFEQTEAVGESAIENTNFVAQTNFGR